MKITEVHTSHVDKLSYVEPRLYASFTWT